MVQRHSPYGGLLHEVVAHGGVLYFAGIVAENTDLDIAGQARDVLTQLDALLLAHGSDRQHVLQATAYLVDLGEKEGLNRAWKEFFGAAHLPARATIGVQDLGRDVRLELVVTAAIAKPA
ncbi:RidA family protein [Methylobacterium nodulans]|uniref:Endoribonuclease L-PSP n=1 Tax=Methylobacterium nodulans (strain LMG 21967 / CNCM I-2342 / ORS 2060) TaxID=460265 RepID=B8IA81_METNO|nr:RidA family protein [Methylobacterium nodulans]ACL59144.1 Endoribonuclease L-PSP [Methylobacterium nodulans ORS 2060]